MSGEPCFGVPDFRNTFISLDTSLIPDSYTVLSNCRLCINGSLTPKNSVLIISQTGHIDEILHAPDGVSVRGGVDLHNGIVAPGFLELQTNGMRGFHFTQFEDEKSYAAKVDGIAQYLPSQGVTGFWATLPTIESAEFKKILPSLRPRDIEGGARLIGAHGEGPYLHPSKKGAHNSTLFQQASTPTTEIYGEIANNNDTLKLVTIAPELENATSLIADLVTKGIRVSLGHSSATFEEGIAALRAGASCITHALNAMAPLHHRDPGLAGLIVASPSSLPLTPWFSIISDGNHLHPAIVRMLFRSNPSKCILISDSVELAGLEDGLYPGNSQIPFNQTKKGNRVVIENTETLIGGCASLSECVQNLMKWSECGIAEAVRCVTENVINLMGVKDRGKLEVGRLADLVVLDDDGRVLQTFVGGRQIWRNRDS